MTLLLLIGPLDGATPVTACCISRFVRCGGLSSPFPSDAASLTPESRGGGIWQRVGVEGRNKLRQPASFRSHTLQTAQQKLTSSEHLLDRPERALARCLTSLQLLLIRKALHPTPQFFEVRFVLIHRQGSAGALTGQAPALQRAVRARRRLGGVASPLHATPQARSGLLII